jgi:hypothetical protein
MKRSFVLIIILILSYTDLFACEKALIKADSEYVIKLTHLTTGKTFLIEAGEYITFKYNLQVYSGRLDSVSDLSFYLGSKPFAIDRLDKIKIKGKKEYMKRTGKILFSVSLMIAGTGLIGYTIWKLTRTDDPIYIYDDWGGVFAVLLGTFALIAFVFTCIPGIALYFIGNEFQYFSAKNWKMESVLK